jgi:hypothetical protein
MAKTAKNGTNRAANSRLADRLFTGMKFAPTYAPNKPHFRLIPD